MEIGSYWALSIPFSVSVLVSRKGLHANFVYSAVHMQPTRHSTQVSEVEICGNDRGRHILKNINFFEIRKMSFSCQIDRLWR